MLLITTILGLISAAQSSRHESTTTTSYSYGVGDGHSMLVMTGSEHTFTPAHDIEIRDLGPPQILRTQDQRSCRACYPLRAFAADTHSIFLVHDRGNGTFEILKDTRHDIGNIRRRRTRKKICFKVPCSLTKMAEYRVLGEDVHGEKWLSKPIVPTGKPQPAICTPEGCLPLLPKRDDRPTQRRPRARRENRIVSTPYADYMLPLEIPDILPESQKDCEGTCCMLYLGMCDRRQPTWRRYFVLLFDVLILLIQLWIIVNICTCCGCWLCRSERVTIDSLEADVHATIAKAMEEDHHRTPVGAEWLQHKVRPVSTYTPSFVETHRPANPAGFKGLMTVEIPAHAANAPRESPQVTVESGSSSDEDNPIVEI